MGEASRISATLESPFAAATNFVTSAPVNDGPRDGADGSKSMEDVDGVGRACATRS